MAALFNKKIWEQGLSGTAALQTGPDFYDMLAAAEKYYLQVRATQVTATSGTPTLTVVIESSNDGVFWTTKATPVSALSLPVGSLTNGSGTDAGTTPGGAKIRLSLSLAGTGPNAFLEVWVCGRSAD